MFSLAGFLCKPKLRPCGALVFQNIVMLILLTDCHKGESQSVGSSQTVVAFVGDDVILPCHLKPAEDAISETVEWSRPDLEPRFVHVWHNSENLLANQNPSFKGRTSLSTEKLKRGDLSLMLSAVKHSDNGIYRCYFPSQEKEFTIELLVGSVSPFLISGVSKDTSGVVLQCESKGWFPEPEVVWLDKKGKVLSAEPKETTKGPDHLFTVSSRLTLKESDDEIFTCRVHQEKINQTRETHIQISADLFEVSSSVAVSVTITVFVMLGVIAAAVFIFWKWRQNQTKEVNPHQDDAERRDGSPLIQAEEKIKDVEEKKRKLEADFEKEKTILEKELKRNEEEEENLEQMVPKMKDQIKEVQEQIVKAKNQTEEMERILKEIGNMFSSAEKKAERDKAQGFLDMTSTALSAQKHLKNIKQEEVKLHNKTQMFENTSVMFLEMMTKRKMTVKSNRREITEQIMEIQWKLSEYKQKT